MGARTKELYFVKMSNIITAVSNIVWFLMPYLVRVFIYDITGIVSKSGIIIDLVFFLQRLN